MEDNYVKKHRMGRLIMKNWEEWDSTETHNEWPPTI